MPAADAVTRRLDTCQSRRCHWPLSKPRENHPDCTEENCPAEEKASEMTPFLPRSINVPRKRGGGGPSAGRAEHRVGRGCWWGHDRGWVCWAAGQAVAGCAGYLTRRWMATAVERQLC